MTSSASASIHSLARSSASYVQSSGRNSLLATLSPEALSLLHPHLREETLEKGAVLWNPGDRVDQVFFPVSGMISIRLPTEPGHAIEVSSIGREGALGVHDGSGMFPVFTQAVIQIPGRFIGISAAAFAAASQQSDEIKRLAAACAGWLTLQSQQIAACNTIHAADARLCRWLLRAADALEVDMVPITQESLANLLGIRRTTATLIGQQLRLRGIISYRRGKIVIDDRAGLEAAACGCYRALGRSYWPSELLRAAAVKRASIIQASRALSDRERLARAAT